VGVAVLLHAFAFIVWDVGSRPPARLFGDLRRGVASARAFTAGLSRFLLGLVLLFAGALLMLSLTVANVRGEFTTLETGAILTGLLIESLVGEPIRAHWRSR
jgi:hypothetical protein